MKLLLLAVAVSALTASGQNSESYKRHGYAYYSVGRWPEVDQTSNAYGAGAEFFVFRGLTLGGEVGQVFSVGRPYTSSFVLAAFNPAWHFAPRGRASTVVPFVTGGIGGAFRGRGGSVLGNYGAGLTWWFHDRLGARLEVRDHVCPVCDSNLVLFRAGISFR